ncbi:protein GVQW3-like [Oratosquilla oratoria]|uniref:protein GVQW3-like n=1 Tax=Oratosquilla oratoria TaxID=337810 RepID=UPI003F763A60
MTERLEQCYCIKFCQKLGNSQVETIREIQTAFGEDARGITQIKEWYNWFKDDRTTVESEPRSDLAMKRVAAKFVLKLLTVEQKQLSVEVSQDMLDSTNSDPDFMNTIITGDKSWLYRYDPSFSLQGRTAESTTQYLTQMLLASN